MPGVIILGGIVAAVVMAALAVFAFRKDLRKAFSLKLLSIAALFTSIFTIGLVFSSTWILRELPIAIVAFAIGSYLISHFFSYYIIRLTYKAIPLTNRKVLDYLASASKELKVRTPMIYSFRSGEDRAFLVGGYRNAIMISESLVSKLDFESLKAVILHELYHLQRNSTAVRNAVSAISTLGLKLIPAPVNEFNELDEDEIDRIMLEEHGIRMDDIRKLLGSRHQ
jgi:Zn-dependent protease with chaperone function